MRSVPYMMYNTFLLTTCRATSSCEFSIQINGVALCVLQGERAVAKEVLVSLFPLPNRPAFLRGIYGRRVRFMDGDAVKE